MKKEYTLCDRCGKEATGQVTVCLEGKEDLILDVCEKCEIKLVEKEKALRADYNAKKAVMYKKFFTSKDGFFPVQFN